MAEGRTPATHIFASLRRLYTQAGNVILALRAPVALPVEALQQAALGRQLDERVGVVFGLFKIEDAFQLAIGEGSGEHSALNLVYRREHVVLLEVEKGGCVSQGVKAPQLHLAVEVGHRVAALYLVETEAVFAHADEGVGVEAGAIHLVVLDQHEETV